ncbi:MAG: hypothetical protein MUF78_08915 [Candidatus Edwardsbacteria bacterium]|nr:hypothetical protein [Candidatus Edwardsbacteria bacterium]
MKRFAAAAVALLAGAALQAGGETVAISVRMGEGGRPELARVTAARCYETLVGIGQIAVTPSERSDSIIRGAGTNAELISPSELGAALGVAKLVLLATGEREQQFIVTARLYDVGKRQLVTSFVDSCLADTLDVAYAARKLAWRLAPNLTMAVTPERAATARDSLDRALAMQRLVQRGEVAMLAEQGRQRTASLRRATLPYDLAAGTALIAAIGFATAGIIQDRAAQQDFNRAQEAYAEYPTLRSGFDEQWAVIESAQRDARTSLERRDAFYCAAAGAGVACAGIIAARLFIVPRKLRPIASIQRPGIAICYAF